MATLSPETHSYIGISGNLADENLPCSGAVITLGTKSNSHYQSLLPIEMFHLDFRHNEQHPNNVNETRKLFNQMKVEDQGNIWDSQSNNKVNDDQTTTKESELKIGIQGKDTMNCDSQRI